MKASLITILVCLSALSLSSRYLTPAEKPAGFVPSTRVQEGCGACARPAARTLTQRDLTGAEWKCSRCATVHLGTIPLGRMR